MSTQEKLLRAKIRENYIEVWGVDITSEVERALVEQEVAWTMTLIDSAKREAIDPKSTLTMAIQMANGISFSLIDWGQSEEEIKTAREMSKTLLDWLDYRISLLEQSEESI